jgi:hypothetical protein
VLCLLTIISGALSPMIDWMQSLEAPSVFLEDTLSDLCRLYYLCTAGRHPLTDDWAIEEYERLVQGNKSAITHYQLLNELCCEGGRLIL